MAFRLTIETIAALDITIEKCRTDSRTFSLGLYEAEAQTVYEFTVAPTTPVQFSYEGTKPADAESSEQAAKLLDGIILEGRVVIVIPLDE